MKVWKVACVACTLAVALAIGFGAAWQWRLAAPTVLRPDTSVSERPEQERVGLVTRIEELQRRLEQAEANELDESQLREALQRDLDAARIEAGTAPVQGPGMLMTITPKDPQARPVGDQELLMVVNELNAAGAETIAINGSRIVASSEIRLAGSHVNINGRPTAAPYVIEAIGPTQTLIAALQLYGGMVDQLTPYHEVTLESEEEMTLPARETAAEFNYATAG